MIALPMLDAMRPVRALAGGINPAKSPVRMAFLFVPNGAHMPDWIPTGEGADFDLPYILQPLQALADRRSLIDLLLFSQLRHIGRRRRGRRAEDLLQNPLPPDHG